MGISNIGISFILFDSSDIKDTDKNYITKINKYK